MNLSEQPNDLQTFVCRPLFEKERAVAYVFADDEDGTVSMLCEGSDCDTDDVKNCIIVGIGDMRHYEPALEKLTELFSGTEAYLAKEKDWVFTPIAREKTQ